MWDAFAGFRGFFWSDPPQYTAHREIWTKAFKPRLKGLASVVQATVDELLDQVGGHVLDVVSALAFPLPATVVFTCSASRARTATCSGASPPSLMAGGEGAIPAIEEAAAWLRGFLDDRQRHPATTC